MRLSIVAVAALSVLLLSLIVPLDYSGAESGEISYFDVKLVDDEGSEVDDILSHRYTVDTITDTTGTTFILRAHVSLQAKSANLLIESNEGLFNCYVTVSGLSSYLEDAGIRVQLQDGDKVYNSDNSKATHFVSTYFVDDSDSRAILKPNVKYPMTIRTLDDVEHEAPPQKVENVVIEFTAHLKEGLHQIAFFSEDKLVEAYKLADGQAIHPLPAAPDRSGYTFGGWFTKDGREIKEGQIVTEDEGDIIAYAKWTAVDQPSSSDAFNWIIYLIAGLIIASIIVVVVIVKRRQNSPGN